MLSIGFITFHNLVWGGTMERKRLFTLKLPTDTFYYTRHGDVLNRSAKWIIAGTTVKVGPIESLRFGGSCVDAVRFQWVNGEQYLILGTIQISGIKATIRHFFSLSLVKS
jgi:hypothetical protein